MAYEVSFDVIQAILDDLACNCDWESIRTLSLTCWDLVEPCQKHLFDTVAIHRTTISQFMAVLIQHPKLASYVLHLHYYTDREGDVDVHIQVLVQFSQLRSLHITGDGTERGTVWDDMPEGLRHQITRLLSLQNLKALSMTRLRSWPVSLFANCCNLRELQIGALGLDVTNLTNFASPPFPPVCKPEKFSIGATSFYFVEQLLAAQWPDGQSIVDLSQITMLYDHSVHVPIDQLVVICGSRIEATYFARLDRFRMLANLNVFASLRVVAGIASLTDLGVPPQSTLPSVEEIYLMPQPTTVKRIKIDHVLAWLNPTLFPRLKIFTVFQEYGGKSDIVVQLPFVSGPASFKTRSVKDVDEFQAIVCTITGFSSFDC